MTIDEAIARLLGNFGEPRDGSPEVLLNEYRRVMTGCDSQVLSLACDRIIDNENYWPRPAAIKKHISAAAATLVVERERTKRATVEVETWSGERDPRVAEMLAGLAKTMRSETDARRAAEPKVTPPSPVDRTAFRAMQEASKTGLHLGRRS